jgi:exopolysaccharide biosynthesis polyprenyl glycosylphosphotransferase
MATSQFHDIRSSGHLDIVRDDVIRLPRVRYKVRLAIADAGAVAAGAVLASVAQRVFRPVPDSVLWAHLMLAAVTLPGFVVCADFTQLYRARANERRAQEAMNVLKCVGIWTGLLVTVGFVVQYDLLSRFWVVAFALGTSAALIAERSVARRMFARLRSTGQMIRRIVIVGTDAHAIGLMHTYERNPALGYEVIGFVGPDELGERGGVAVLGEIEDLPRILGEYDANGVVVSLASVNQDAVNALTRRLTDDGFHVALSSSLRDIDLSRLRPQQLDGRTMIYVEPVIRTGWRAVAKRVFDLTVGSFIFVVTLPVLLAAMVAIKIDSPGPVLFRQTRVGRNGRPFVITKLRTMVVDAEERKAELLDQNEVDGPLFKIALDPRVTRVGRILRNLSIDELPQLWSVFAGTMSMVGPRPALPCEVEEWDESLRDRLRVLPGLTGMWQVSGRSGTTFEEYKRLDLYYVDNWSLMHDLRICARTVKVVLTGRGAA